MLAGARLAALIEDIYGEHPGNEYVSTIDYLQ